MIYQNDFGDISPASTHASNDETHDVILIDHSAQFLNVCCWMQLLANIPSLNPKSCIKGLLVVQDFCFWAIWEVGLVDKKKVWGRL